MANDRLIRVPEWFASSSTRFIDVSAALRSPHVTLADAEAYASSLSVAAHYSTHLTLANMINETLTQLKERNLPLFAAVFVHRDFFRQYGDAAENIAARTEYNSLFVNPDAIAWSDPSAVAMSLYESRFWSTPHPLHALYHEAGHLFLPQIGEPKRLLPRQIAIAEAVSFRAKQNVEEFVAEVFAGLMCGVEYDRDMISLYRRLGGKKP